MNLEVQLWVMFNIALAMVLGGLIGYEQWPRPVSGDFALFRGVHRASRKVSAGVANMPGKTGRNEKRSMIRV